MRVSDAFPSNWLKAEDLRGKRVKVTIDRCELEDVGDGQKPVLYFVGKNKGIVLNKTNASMIADSFGDEMDAWAGKDIEIFGDKTAFQGKIVPCIRVKPLVPVAADIDDEPPLEEPPF